MRILMYNWAASFDNVVSDDFIDSFFEKLAQQVRCGWCCHPRQTKLTSGLCSHCYRIRRQVLSLESQIKDEGLSIERKHDYKVALRKAQLARSEGLRYGNINKRDISALDLEHELDDLAKNFVNQKIFYGEATSIGWRLPSNQRMYVFYLLSLMQREYLRRNRHRMAEFDIAGMTLAEVQALNND